MSARVTELDPDVAPFGGASVAHLSLLQRVRLLGDEDLKVLVDGVQVMAPEFLAVITSLCNPLESSAAKDVMEMTLEVGRKEFVQLLWRLAKYDGAIPQKNTNQ